MYVAEPFFSLHPLQEPSKNIQNTEASAITATYKVSSQLRNQHEVRRLIYFPWHFSLWPLLGTSALWLSCHGWFEAARDLWAEAAVAVGRATCLRCVTRLLEGRGAERGEGWGPAAPLAAAA